MRPVHLEFSGLRSYRGHAEIDFSTYDLFAIIGDTGAGKSTVIEALSLALYAKKTWSGGASLSELIADGQNTMTIRLRFASGGDEWEVTRTRHRNASAPVDRLVGLTTGEHVDNATPVSNRIREIVGLSHEQFTRAVVMPQGRFDELLTAKPTERNKILRSIFGFDDLERLRELAHDQRVAWSQTLAVHDDRRRGLPADPEVELAVVRARLVAVRTAESVCSGALAAADEAAGHLARRDLVERLASALSSVPVDTADAVAELERARQRGEELLAARSEADAARATADAEIGQVSAHQTELLAGFADRDAAVRAASDLGAAVPVLTRAIEAGLELDEVEATVGEAVDIAVALAPLDSAVERATETLGVAQSRRDEARHFAQMAADARARLADTVAALSKAETDLATAETAHQHAEASRVAAADTQAWAADDVTRREAEVQALTQQHLAADLAHGHGPGDPCPVCRRPLDADYEAPVVPDLDEAKQLAQRARKHELDARRALVDAETTTKVAAAAANRAHESCDRAEADHRRAAAAVAEFEVPDVESADAAIALAEEERQAAVDARSARRAALEQQQTARLDALRAVEKGRAAVRQDLGTITAGISSLPAAWSKPVDADQPTVEAVRAAHGAIEHMLGESAEVAQRLETARAAAQAASSRLGAITAEAANQVTTPATQALGRVREHVRAVVAACELIIECDDAAEVADIPLLEAPLLEEGVKTSTLGQTVASVAGALTRCDEAIVVGRTVVDAQRQALADWDARLAEALSAGGASSVEALRTAAAEAASEVGMLEREVREAEASGDKAAAADAVLVVVRPLVANLAVVEEALRDRAGRFIDHLVGTRERELLAEASRRLKTISSGRHGFVADFGVANIASGEVRPPDALSGGERFQAALALALALVEIASRGGGHLDAVFVDEGFGSLDAAALDAALETLGGVAGGGKMVGLISHLRPVAEYVDTVLHVTKDDTEGSRIRPLDPDARERLLDDEVRSGLTA